LVHAFSDSASGSKPSGYSRLLVWLDSVNSFDLSSPAAGFGSEAISRPTRLPVDDEMGKSDAMGDVTPKMSEKPQRSTSASASGFGSSTGSAEGGAGRDGGGAGRAGGAEGREGGSAGRAEIEICIRVYNFVSALNSIVRTR
jgi:hypothetical protein